MMNGELGKNAKGIAQPFGELTGAGAERLRRRFLDR